MTKGPRREFTFADRAKGVAIGVLILIGIFILEGMERRECRENGGTPRGAWQHFECIGDGRGLR